MAVIKDRRLGALYYFLTIAVVLVLLIWTISAKTYQMSVDPSGLIFSYWANKGEMKEIQDKFNKGYIPEHCEQCKYNS